MQLVQHGGQDLTHSPFTKLYPGGHDVHVLAELQVRQLGGHLTHLPPNRKYPGLHSAHTVSEVQLAQLGMVHSIHSSPSWKVPGGHRVNWQVPSTSLWPSGHWQSPELL